MSGRQVLVKWLVRRLRTAKVNKDSAPSSAKARFQRDIECCEALLALLAAKGLPRCKTCPHMTRGRDYYKGPIVFCGKLHGHDDIPADGSGYCHLHPDAKETRWNTP